MNLDDETSKETPGASAASGTSNDPKQPYRPPYILLACLAPILTPLGYALVLLTGFDAYGKKLGTALFGPRGGTDPTLLFIWGWLGLTVACGAYLAWRICSKAHGAWRVIAFIFVWLMMSAVLQATGAAIGFPACMWAMDKGQ